MVGFPDIDRSTDLVRNSWQFEIAPRAEELAVTFYSLLFEIEPESAGLFPSDRTQQRAQLMMMMEFLVTHDLHAPETKEQIRQLGRRYFGNGVPIGLFLIFGKTMNYAMSTMLVDKWTIELSTAWSTMFRQVYDVIVYDYV